MNAKKLGEPGVKVDSLIISFSMYTKLMNCIFVDKDKEKNINVYRGIGGTGIVFVNVFKGIKRADKIRNKSAIEYLKKCGIKDTTDFIDRLILIAKSYKRKTHCRYCYDIKTSTFEKFKPYPIKHYYTCNFMIN